MDLADSTCINIAKKGKIFGQCFQSPSLYEEVVLEEEEFNQRYHFISMEFQQCQTQKTTKYCNHGIHGKKLICYYSHETSVSNYL